MTDSDTDTSPGHHQPPLNLNLQCKDDINGPVVMHMYYVRAYNRGI